MAAASSPLLRRLLSRRSMTPPSRIFHTNASRDSGNLWVKLKLKPPFEFENSPSIQQKHTAEGQHFRIDMPGLSKEDVEFSVMGNMMIIEGKGEFGQMFRSEIEFPKEKLYNEKAIKAEMKNGVLTAFLPKIKDEERSDVFKVNIE